MARWGTSNISHLVQKDLFVLGVIFLIRMIFLATNYSFFADLPFMMLVKAMVYAVRIDCGTLLWINGWLLLLVCLVPITSLNRQKLVSALFVLLNGTLVLMIICDNIYFTYTRHRINYDVLLLVPQSFTIKLLGVYFVNGWYWVLLLILIILLFRRLFTGSKIVSKNVGSKERLVRAVVIVIVCFIGMRGFESRPLSPSTILLYFPPKAIDLVSNTGFNLMYSYYKTKEQLREKNYFTPAELDNKFQIVNHGSLGTKTNKPNIVLMVMESFARDFLDSSSRYKARTPFLDSLMGKSLVFRNAFNNGRESTHGLVAILASLPPFMQVPYYHSQYHSTSIRGIGRILRDQGYDCSFFLGDVDDSFGFKEFTNSIGIDHYYSREDFNDDRFYNGAWGIHDENFFLYAGDILAKKPSPFFATIFNVSSHPPYIIPDHLKKQFTIAGQSPAQNSVSYVDHSYHSFFQKIKNEPWFKNTVFIFIADHFLQPSEKKMLTSENINEIPFFIYAPGAPGLQGTRDYVVQQLDVLPTILDLTGYQGTFMSFGKSVLAETQPRYAVQKLGYIYQVVDSSYSLGLNSGNDEVIYLYNYRSDPMQKLNLFREPSMLKKKSELSSQLKAMIQRYNSSFINNRLLY